MDSLQYLFACRDGLRLFLNKGECPDDGRWHNVTGIYTKENKIMNVYIDGELKNGYCPLFNRRY